jgi:hypothetical protein
LCCVLGYETFGNSSSASSIASNFEPTPQSNGMAQQKRRNRKLVMLRCHLDLPKKILTWGLYR